MKRNKKKKKQIFYYLTQNEEVLRKVQAEVDEVLGSENSFELEDISELTYLKYVIQETLRIMPPVPFLNRTNMDVIIIFFFPLS